MADSDSDNELKVRNSHPKYWTMVIVAFIALCAVTLVATRRHDRADQQATASSAATGVAYDPTSGRTVPAGATPGSIGTTTVAPSVSALAVNTPAPATQPATAQR